MTDKRMELIENTSSVCNKTVGATEDMTSVFRSRIETAPEELMQRTLLAMQQREKETRQKKAAYKTFALRSAAIAAVITLLIVVTPMRGYVASAAENAWNAIHNWVDDVFHVGLKQSDNGCTVEIIDARVANDFLYLTVQEDYTGFVNKNPEEYYLSQQYNGSIYDDDNHTLKFSSGCVNMTSQNPDANDHSYQIKQTGEKYRYLREYKIYLPELKKLIMSYDKEYYCDLSVNVLASANGQTKKKIAGFDFNFKIDKVYSVMESSEHPVDYSYTIGNMKFDFKKLYVGPTESNFLVELIPTGDLAEQDLTDGRLTLNCTVCKDQKASELLDVSSGVYFFSDNLLYDSGSKYYIFLTTDSKENELLVYDENTMLNQDGETKFVALSFGYEFTSAVSDFEESATSNYTTDGMAHIINQPELTVRDSENGTIEINQTVTLDFLSIYFKSLQLTGKSEYVEDSFAYSLEADVSVISNDEFMTDKIEEIEIYDIDLFAEKDGHTIDNVFMGINGYEYDERIYLRKDCLNGTFTKAMIGNLTQTPDKFIINSISFSVKYEQSDDVKNTETEYIYLGCGDNYVKSLNAWTTQQKTYMLDDSHSFVIDS